VRAVVLASVIAVAVAHGQPAVAASPVQAGWWSAVPAAAYPDVPADGLVVQGGLTETQPLAYGAVTATVTKGATFVALTLSVAPGSASTAGATLAACPLAGPFSAAQGGGMAEAPPFDCATEVTAAPSPDGSVYVFEVTALVRDAKLAVAIVPTAPTDRVVLQRPALEESVTASRARPSAVPPPAQSEGGNDSAVPADAATAVEATPAAAPEVAAPTPGVPEAGTSPANSAPQHNTLRPTSAAPSVSAGSDDSDSPVAAIGLVALAVLAAVLWVSAGRTSADGSRGGTT
jgi:hypothetical protein